MTGSTLSLRQSAAGPDRIACNHDRLERLLQGQRELLELSLTEFPLEGILHRLERLVESIFAPDLCTIFVVKDGRPIHRGNLLAADGEQDEDAPHPAQAAAGANEAVGAADLLAGSRWPHHAANALVHGWRAVWAEPFRASGAAITGAVAWYGRSAGEPDAADQTLLRHAAHLAGLVIESCIRQAAYHSVNSRLASLSSALPGVIYQRAVSPDGDIRYTYISDGARDLFGVSAEEILADPEALFRRHGAEYKAKFRERLLAASRALTMWDVEATIVTPDGQQKYTHAIARPERQPDGSTLWTGLILDETRTREALVDGLSQGFLLFGSDDKLILRNRHFLKLFPSLSSVAVPGASYEEIALAELASVHSFPEEDLRSSSEFRSRMENHSKSDCMFEQQIASDRWILVNEHRNREGGVVVLYTDISELRERERELRHLAYHDSLTGLPNRILFQQRVESALLQARARGKRVAVMCLDLDHFKNVNDTLGHAAGDTLLRCVADRLSACFRNSDTVSRLSGDEFAIVLADLQRAETATMVAWRLLDVIGQPIEYNGQQIVPGISIGIADSSCEQDTAEHIVKKADLALYRAKADGRGTFRFFEEEMDALAQARRALELDLRQAVGRDQLEVHYQPLVNLGSDEVVGFEALVRWRHPERGMIAPGEFIPLAEETGVIIRLGEWVLWRACTDALTWPDTVRVAVNVSAAQFRNHDLTQRVSEILRETGLAPNRLELEVTESLLLRDVDANLTTLRNLKALGIRISMDDFGTGYSSLGNLRSFPFDKIKIDRSFVGDLESSNDAVAIVHAVLGLGQSLGMTTCAEGVETGNQLAYLRTEGCCEVQGYYYSKPKTAAEVKELLVAAKEGRLAEYCGNAPKEASPAAPADPCEGGEAVRAADRRGAPQKA